MRPQPSEIIAGVRAILSDVIAPELTSEHARSRLAEIRAVLAQVNWDNAGFLLKARAVALAQGLVEAASWIPPDMPQPPAEDNFEAYQRYWEDLGVIAAAVLERLADHLDRHPEDHSAQADYRRLLDVV